MKRRFLFPKIGNRQSKIENRKSKGSAERAGAGGPGDQVKKQK
jgi:hypothetical protein